MRSNYLSAQRQLEKSNISKDMDELTEGMLQQVTASSGGIYFLKGLFQEYILCSWKLRMPAERNKDVHSSENKRRHVARK
jgi:hypothetical protein